MCPCSSKDYKDSFESSDEQLVQVTFVHRGTRSVYECCKDKMGKSSLSAQLGGGDCRRTIVPQSICTVFASGLEHVPICGNSIESQAHQLHYKRLSICAIVRFSLH